MKLSQVVVVEFGKKCFISLSIYEREERKRINSDEESHLAPDENNSEGISSSCIRKHGKGMTESRLSSRERAQACCDCVESSGKCEYPRVMSKFSRLW